MSLVLVELGIGLNGSGSYKLILLLSLRFDNNLPAPLELVDPRRSSKGFDFSGFIDTRFSLKLILALFEPPGLLRRFFYLLYYSDSKKISVSFSMVGSVSNT